MVQDRVPQARIYKVWNIPEYGSAEGDYLDLVKLTLGAFIGSFVQGQNDSRTRSRNNIANQKPG